MKRSIALILSLLLVFALLSGCAGGEADTTESANTTGPAVTATLEPEDEPPAADLSLYPLAESHTLTATGPMYTPRAAGVIENWADALPYKLVSEATNIQLDYATIPTEAWKEQFKIMVAGDDLADLVLQAVSNYGGSADSMVENESFIDISPYLEEYAPDYLNALNTYDNIKNATTDSGNMVTFYTVQDQPGYASRGPVIRQDWLDEIGMTSPETYDDYYNVLKAFKTQLDVTEPLAMSETGVPEGDYLASGFGITLHSHFALKYGNDGFYQVDGKVKFGYSEEGFAEYVTLMNEWFNEGLISADFTQNAGNLPNLGEKILNGETGIFYIDRYNIDTYEATAAEPGFKLAGIIDATKTASEKTHAATYRESLLSEGYSISANCKNPEIAVLWNNFWYTDEGAMYANYGEQDLTYEYVNGVPAFTDFILNNPDGLTMSQTTYIYTTGPGITIVAKEKSMYSERALGLSDIWATNKDNTYKLPGMATMTADESDEYTRIFSDISTYVAENMIKFIVGQKPLTEISEFQNQLKEMEVDTCIALWQDAIDRYYAR